MKTVPNQNPSLGTRLVAFIREMNRGWDLVHNVGNRPAQSQTLYTTPTLTGGTALQDNTDRHRKSQISAPAEPTPDGNRDSSGDQLA